MLKKTKHIYRLIKGYYLFYSFLLFSIILHPIAIAQVNPVFGSEIQVNIIGLNTDAMEPFLSPDGNYIFYNSLNSGGNTNLHKAVRINDSTFAYDGLLTGTTDTSANHLDGVPSLDSAGNFYWVSLRNYPTNMFNLHTGDFNSASATVNNIHRVYGSFNIPILNLPFGWLIMDASVSYTGNELYYCNALFDLLNNSCNGLPCKASLGFADKINDTTFNKNTNSDSYLSLINDTNYLVYAPYISKNKLELYFTRLLQGTINTEICVSTRSSVFQAFGTPQTLISNVPFIPEAPCLSNDETKLYYHHKNSLGQYNIYLKYRQNPQSDLTSSSGYDTADLYPNPVSDVLNISLQQSENYIISSPDQKTIMKGCGKKIDVSELDAGIYFVEFIESGTLKKLKFIKIR